MSTGSRFVRSFAKNLKLTADQANTVTQLNDGICLKKGEGGRIDFRGAAHYVKLAADQEMIVAQLRHGISLHQGESVRTVFRRAVYYFKLAADQRIVVAQCNHRVLDIESESQTGIGLVKCQIRRNAAFIQCSSLRVTVFLQSFVSDRKDS
jgi:TPR repeat protein